MGAAPGLIQEVEVAAGATTNVEIQLRGGRRVKASFWLDGGVKPRELAYTCVDRKGRTVLGGSLTSGTNTVDIWLTEGDYTLTARDGRGHKAKVELRVVEAAEPDEITIQLRTGG